MAFSIKKLRCECLRADLGQIFISYQIPLNLRSQFIGGTMLKGLLQFIFRRNDADMASKISDALKIVSIYERLKETQMLTAIECYYLYGLTILQQLTDENEVCREGGACRYVDSAHSDEGVDGPLPAAQVG